MEISVQKNKRGFGAEGEDYAAAYLAKNGFEIICRNFRFGRLGEIDIIAHEAEYICFIEVKTRSSNLFGSPAEAVDARKQLKIRQLALVYLKKYNLSESFIRFDVAEIVCRKDSGVLKPFSVNLIRNAF
jgi:putative endonuclease